MVHRVKWEGVFPAVTNQFKDDFSLDVEATRRVIDVLIRDGVSGLIVCGTVGEKAEIEAMMKEALANRPTLPDVGLRTAA